MKQAILLAAVLSILVAASTARAQNYRFEAELGTLNGSFIASSIPGFSGTGYVSFYNDIAQSVQVRANVPDGLYELWVGYTAPLDPVLGKGVRLPGRRSERQWTF